MAAFAPSADDEGTQGVGGVLRDPISFSQENVYRFQ
jgi:hypothetical protein